jgi:hypothetical protein
MDNEKPEDAIKRIMSSRIQRFEIKERMDTKRTFSVNGDTHGFTVFLVESFTNIPVNMKEEKKKHDNYIWLNKTEAISRLHWSEEKAIYGEAVDKILLKQSTI